MQHTITPTLLLFLTACTLNPPTPVQAASDIATAFCTHLESCGDEPADTVTHERCLIGVRTNLLTQPAGPWTLTVDEGSLANCLDTIRGLDCVQEWLPSVCFEALWTSGAP